MLDKGTILSIDDDENLQTVIAQYLESEGYVVTTAGNFKSAIEKVAENTLDVILLDLVLPDGEGMTLIPQIKTQTNACIIVVSGKSDTTEKIICLEMGADDYLTKPFEMRELVARIKAVMRRAADTPAQTENAEKDKSELIYFHNGWCLNRAQYQAFTPDNISTDLTTGEFQLLEALILSPGRALSREQLFDLTRDGDYDAYDRAIDIQIGRLRKKLNDDTNTLIKTVRGIGYMFSGQID